MILFLLFLLYEPEDSNNMYLIDQMLVVPEEQFIVAYDSAVSGLFTTQGCLDLMNWYIKLDIKHDAWLSSWLGLRYRYRKIGDYDRSADEHRFEPTFKIGKQNLHLMIIPRYYKGGDEIGIGYSTGSDYLNYLQLFLSVPDFDRNFSLRDTPDSLPRYKYKRFPIRLSLELRRRWGVGYFKFIINRILPSFQIWEGQESIRSDEFGYSAYLTSWHGRFNLGFAADYNVQNERNFDMVARVFNGDSLSWFEVQPWVGFRISKRWTVFFRYRVETKWHKDDLSDYHREGNSQYLDIHYRMSDHYLWHFGYQGEYLESGMLKIVNNHRFVVGLEYDFNRGRFVLWEGIEADRPWRIARFHNHTYLSFLVNF
ncbi:MAG TPA: hypothetical protein EYP58_04055 [bacterium (Candidatus Stahlbacteria)]|nr:hypothetical protein [Candidatus Stahlbacteria bacterium]